MISNNQDISDASKKLLKELSEIARRGPIESRGKGAPGVGLTLLHHLGIEYESSKKPQKYGIVVSARRGNKTKDPNRVNLFSAVPDWDISNLKSSFEILNKVGYEREGVRRLNCTVDSKQPNPQGLQLKVNRDQSLLEEWFYQRGEPQNIVSWRLNRLQEKLALSHPETIWVTAQTSRKNDVEHFHYRFATVTAAARIAVFPELLSEGTITMDHLITNINGRALEKGPLFKIRPKNIPLLFPENSLFDLMRI